MSFGHNVNMKYINNSMMEMVETTLRCGLDFSHEHFVIFHMTQLESCLITLLPKIVSLGFPSYASSSYPTDKLFCNMNVSMGPNNILICMIV